VTRGPDRKAALAQYRGRAGTYDLELALFEDVRREAVAALALRKGDKVFDVGCGTGLSLALLRHAVGPRGRVVGIEQSAAMLARARARVAEHGWANVDLVEAPVETADLPVVCDAALFHFTHDVLQRAEAVANVVTHLRPGARVVATGIRWAPRWALAVNLAVYVAARRSVTTFEGLDRPSSLLEQRIGPMAVTDRWLGAVYVACGTSP
jgi:precorrin-6B methylase 2